jgi:septal ring factor EnvC (AmiA/AmiB activator)
MNINHLTEHIRRVEIELKATQVALRGTRALLFAALEQLQQRGQFDPKTLQLPEEAQESKKLREWLERVTQLDTPAS